MKMRTFFKAGVVCALVCAFCLPAGALTLKVGSLAPENSPWDLSLRKIASQLKVMSGNRIKLRIYPGGIVGGEADMIRKIKIGQLDAAALTATGLSLIDSNVLSLVLPLMYENEEELLYVLDKMKPRMEALFRQKKFVVIAWNRAGWIYFYSKKPIVYPRDLKSQKLAVTAGSAKILSAWRSAGFQAVPMATINVMAALQSGMIDATYTTPISAATYQWFGIARYMCNVKVAPLVCAVVVSTRSWRRIPEALRPKIIDAADKNSQILDRDVRKLEGKAMAIMKKHGLIVTDLPEDAKKLWLKEMVNGNKALMGHCIRKDIFDEVMNQIKAYRSKKGL